MIANRRFTMSVETGMSISYVFLNENRSSGSGQTAEVLLSLLNKVGEDGQEPLLATLLYRAGVEEEPDDLYPSGDPGDSSSWAPSLFAIYKGQSKYGTNEPDELLLVQSSDFVGGQGNARVQVNHWLNTATTGRDTLTQDEKVEEYSMIMDNEERTWLVSANDKALIIDMTDAKKDGSGVKKAPLGLLHDLYETRQLAVGDELRQYLVEATMRWHGGYNYDLAREYAKAPLQAATTEFDLL
jgi:hypothetical protein